MQEFILESYIDDPYIGLFLYLSDKMQLCGNDVGVLPSYIFNEINVFLILIIVKIIIFRLKYYFTIVYNSDCYMIFTCLCITI